MAALICAIAITMTPAPADCQRGGHARSDFGERGGLAAAVLPPIGDVRAWTCIHNGTPVGGGEPGTNGSGEGPWNARGGTYWGGLQMDVGFMRHYGADMIRRYRGWANLWSPRDQMVVAERARSSGRGYYPWPNTARACGLI